MTSVPVNQLSYQQAMEELDNIVDGLDAGTVDIDTLSEQFQRAIDLIEELDGRIRSARDKVEGLVPKLDEFSQTSTQGVRAVDDD